MKERSDSDGCGIEKEWFEIAQDTPQWSMNCAIHFSAGVGEVYAAN